MATPPPMTIRVQGRGGGGGITSLFTSILSIVALSLNHKENSSEVSRSVFSPSKIGIGESL